MVLTSPFFKTTCYFTHSSGVLPAKAKLTSTSSLIHFAAIICGSSVNKIKSFFVAKMSSAGFLLVGGVWNSINSGSENELSDWSDGRTAVGLLGKFERTEIGT